MNIQYPTQCSQFLTNAKMRSMYNLVVMSFLLYYQNTMVGDHARAAQRMYWAGWRSAGLQQAYQSYANVKFNSTSFNIVSAAMAEATRLNKECIKLNGES